jgi:hypothetical protein
LCDLSALAPTRRRRLSGCGKLIGWARNCKRTAIWPRRFGNAAFAAALEAHEHAGVSGLCQEGRWEVAIDAIRSLDLGALLAQNRAR